MVDLMRSGSGSSTRDYTRGPRAQNSSNSGSRREGTQGTKTSKSLGCWLSFKLHFTLSMAARDEARPRTPCQALCF